MKKCPSRIRKSLVVVTYQMLALYASADANACPDCATSRTVWYEVAANNPGSTLGILTLAFCLVAGFIVLSARFMQRSRLLFGGAMLLGAGLGAFLDGITLHQVLQWHAMISSVVVPLDLVSSKVNMFWDGIFHLYAWAATVVAVTIVVREVPKASPEVRTRAVYVYFHNDVKAHALCSWLTFCGRSIYLLSQYTTDILHRTYQRDTVLPARLE